MSKTKVESNDNMIEMVDLSNNKEQEQWTQLEKPSEIEENDQWVQLDRPTESEQKEIDELNKSAAIPVSNNSNEAKGNKPKEKNAFNFFMTNLCTFLIDSKINNNQFSGFITFAVSLIPALIYSGWKSFKRERPKLSDVIENTVDMLKEQDPEYVGNDEDKFKSLAKDSNGLEIENEKDLITNILDLKDEKNKDAFKSLEEDGAFLQFFKDIFGVEYKDMYGEKTEEQNKEKSVLGNSLMDKFVKAYIKNKEQKVENKEKENSNLDNSLDLPEKNQIKKEEDLTLPLDSNIIENSRQDELLSFGITTEEVEYKEGEFNLFSQVATEEEVLDSTMDIQVTIEKDKDFIIK